MCSHFFQDFKTYGALPNSTYINSCDFESSHTDIIFSGSIIGELGVLTGRQSEAIITCETPCEVPYAYQIHISINDTTTCMSLSLL